MSTSEELDRAILGDWEQVDDPSPNGASRLRRVDLGDLVERPAVKPRLHEALIYPAKLHSIGGEPGQGKSTVLLYWLLKAIIREHPVVLFDWEAGRAHTADVLHSFGADRATVSKYLIYFPHAGINFASPADVSEVAAELRRIKPVITGFDSTIAVLAGMGGRENDASDIRRMWNSLAPIAHTLGCAVVATDHSGKDAAESKYNRGSTDKLAAVDVSFKLAAEQTFSRSRDGKLNITVTKDRPGWLHWWWNVTVTRDPLALTWQRSREPEGKRGDGGLTPGKAKLLSAVTTEPSPRKDVVDRMAAQHGHGLSRKWSGVYLNELADDGLVDKIEQAGQETLWMLAGSAPVEPKRDVWSDQG